MAELDSLAPEWKEWLVQNIRNGCTYESIAEVMIEHGFESDDVNTVIRNVVRLESFVYESPIFAYSGNFINASDRKVRIAARFDKPCIAILDGLLSKQECSELIQLSRSKLERSKTIDPVTGLEEVISDRTSWGAFYQLHESEFISRLDRRISEVMNWPIENGEGLQVLNYKVGAEYRPHFDYFSEDETGSKVHLAKGGQRVSTLVVYLNDVEAGGETIFPEIGLSVKPKAGSAVYFEYCNSLGQVDPLSLHGGAPVVKGEKWIATKWMRQGKYT